MIDIHMLLTDRLPEGWQEQAIASVHAAIENSPVPVTFHTLPENQEDFWKARWDGYMLGNNPWCTYLDADDWLEPNVFEAIAPYLSKSTDLIQTHAMLYDVPSGVAYKAQRGLRIHSRRSVELADRESREVCCPSCYLARRHTSLVIPDRVVTFRAGYTSLASQWRKENGMG